MVSPIRPIASPLPAPAAGPAAAGKAAAGSFRDLLEGAINGVEGFRHEADVSISKAISGNGEDLHKTALAAQRAELAFDLFLQVRNKVVSAYQEVMRIQL